MNNFLSPQEMADKLKCHFCILSEGGKMKWADGLTGVELRELSLECAGIMIKLLIEFRDRRPAKYWSKVMKEIEALKKSV